MLVFTIIINMITSILGVMVVGCVVGAAAGYLGSFMVLKRMALVGDALSHVALPGIALALSLQISPMAGAFCALMLAVFGIWYFESTSRTYPEALVGVFFTMSLALGIILTPEPELLEALFGNIESINLVEGIFAVLLSLLIMVFTRLLSSKLLLTIISEDVATSLHIKPKQVNLLYLILVGTIVALGVKFVGTLLMGSLVIIPAVSARNISRNFSAYTKLSVLFGIISAIIGTLLATLLSISTGPAVVLVSVTIFLLTYAFKQD